MMSPIFVIFPILLGLIMIATYLRHFFHTWKEVNLMLPMKGTTLEEAQRLFDTIETKIAGDTILERRLKQRLS